MNDFCFGHAADLHLGSPFAGLIAQSDEAASVVASAPAQALDALVRLCQDRSAAFLVLAGDVFDSPSVGIRPQYQLYSALSSLADMGIPSFVACGNHDPMGSWRSPFNWSDAVHFFGPEVEWVPVHRRAPQGDVEPIALVGGISYPRAEVFDNLALGFARNATPPRAAAGSGAGTCLRVGVLHCNVGGVAEHDNYAPCTIDDLCALDLDYWALGHVHQHRVLIPPGEGRPVAVYPGCTQGRNPRETGPRGCCVVHVSQGRVAHVEFVPLDTVRWTAFDLDITDLAGMDQLLDTLTQRCAVEAAEASRDALAVRVRLVGRGALHRELARMGPVELGTWLRDGLQDEAQARGQWWWLESVKAATRPPIDTAALAQSGGLVAELLAEADRLAADDGSLAELASCLQQEFNHPRVRAVLESISPGDWRDLVGEAEALALDLLLDGEGGAGA